MRIVSYWLSLGHSILERYADRFCVSRALDCLSKSISPLDVPEPLILKSETVGKFLLHRESSIRIAALSLLIVAPSPTKPLTSSAMAAIINGLPSVHAESDAHSRGVILSLTRKLILRLKGGILKDGVGFKPHYPSDDEWRQHSKPVFERDESETEAYVDRYVKFLHADLRPPASYQRHITALKALLLVLESGLDPLVDASVPKGEAQWKIPMDIFSPGLFRSLTDLLIDPFDDVRATSLHILNIFPRSILLNNLQLSSDASPERHMSLIHALSRAERLASNTSRADHADAVAHLYRLLFEKAETGGRNGQDPWWLTKLGLVNDILEKAEDKLSPSGALFNNSMRDAPLHGYLCALRYCIFCTRYTLIRADDSQVHCGHSCFLFVDMWTVKYNI